MPPSVSSVSVASQAPQAFEQKQGVGEGLAHAGNNVLPGGQGHHVAGITAEPVDSALTPGQKDARQSSPRSRS